MIFVLVEFHHVEHGLSNFERKRADLWLGKAPQEQLIITIACHLRAEGLILRHLNLKFNFCLQIWIAAAFFGLRFDIFNAFGLFGFEE